MFAFENDEEQLEKNAEGMFVAAEGAEPEQVFVTVHKGMLERSNVDWVREMTQMISAQRAYQSAAEVIKMYDTVMNRITQEVGRLT